MRIGPPDDGPILILEVLRLDRAPPATVTHRHISFLKAHLKLSTPHLPSDILYNKDLIDQSAAQSVRLLVDSRCIADLPGLKAYKPGDILFACYGRSRHLRIPIYDSRQKSRKHDTTNCSVLHLMLESSTYAAG